MIEVLNYGPSDAKIMVVGEAAGQVEEQQGRPFVGPAGEILRKHLLMAGINPDTDVYYANICNVRPPANQIREFFDDKGLPNELVQMGMYRLAQDIQRIKPNVIVPVGNYPLAMLTGRARWRRIKDKRTGKQIWVYSGIQDWRGSIVESRMVAGFKCIPTYHPSYILREGRADHGAWDCDWQRIKRESEFPEIRAPWLKKEFLLIDGTRVRRIVYDTDRAYHFEETEYSRDELHDWLLKDMAAKLTVDIERIGGKLLCVGMTVHRDRAITIAMRTMEDVTWVESILTSGIALNAQNAMFEASIMEWHYKMPIMQHIKFDTMLAAHAANIELPKALEYLVSIFTDQPYYKDMINWKLVAKGKQPIEDVFAYNVLDVWTQHEVMEEQILFDLDEQCTRDTFDFEMALLPPLWEVSKRGLLIDRKQLVRLKMAAHKRIAKNNGLLRAITGQAVFNSRGDDVKRLLFDMLKLPVYQLTDSKKPAVNDKVLAEMLIDYADHPVVAPVIRAIREERSALSQLSKLLEVEFEEYKNSIWRSHGMYNPGGTDTGRLSSKKFYPTENGIQQQNVPRDDEVRSLFIPDEGMEFGYADLERAESLVVAHLTGDERMLADHAHGTDAHRSLAAALYTRMKGSLVTEEEINEEQRYMGKQTRHAGNYMEGPITFRTNVNKYAEKTGFSITPEMAKFCIQTYRDLHPGLASWWRWVEDELRTKGYLFNLLGRRRIFYGHVHSIVPAAVAFTPQSTVGDVLNVGILNIVGILSPYMRKLGIWDQYVSDATWLRENGFQILNQVHDSICFQYPLGLRAEILPRVRRLLAIPLTVPKTLETFTIPVEVKHGLSSKFSTTSVLCPTCEEKGELKMKKGKILCAICGHKYPVAPEGMSFQELRPGGSWGECVVYEEDLKMAA